ncbi:phosphoserine phosphatase SerB [Porphyromonas somerae]|uniref:phosphoserine phosphatase SerB n=1 Tax=Porphyromonas somerae TaxID=322095 RepID=UPI001FCBC71D|nr:phosphoserine phosphatase SerB [Porphyromonas somerae]BDE81453.1 hypothetical protein CE91St14_04810 [Porphyromonas somerae]
MRPISTNPLVRIISPDYERYQEIKNVHDPISRKQLLKELIDRVRREEVLIQYVNPSFTQPKLVAFDLDGTLVAGEFIHTIATQGVTPEMEKELRQLTEEALNGVKDWSHNYEKRVALLQGTRVKRLENIYQLLPLAEGAKELIASLKIKGIKTAIISGAWSEYAEYIARITGIEHCFATRWELDNGQVTGRISGPILSPEAKWEVLRQLAEEHQILPKDIVVVADGYNDLEMMTHVGSCILLHATPHHPLPLMECVQQILCKEFTN